MTFRTAASALALILVSAPAMAGIKTSYGDFDVNLGLVTDYRFRGITRNDEGPVSLQGGVNWTHNSGVYVGLWASTVDLPDARFETDFHAGYKITISGLTLDAGVTGYFFPGSSDALDYNFWEGRVSASYDAGYFTLGTGLSYSPDYFRGSGDATYWSMTGRVPIGGTSFSLLGHLGHLWIDNDARLGAPNYFDWSLGVSYMWEGFDFTAKYVDININPAVCNFGNDGCDATGVLSVTKGF